MKPRLVIYTVLIGQKEPLRNPLETLPAGSLTDRDTDLDLDFVCLTDRPQQASPVWRMLPLTDRHLPADKLSRRPKAMPHEYFPDTTHSLYIDNTVSFKRLPQQADLRLAMRPEHEFLFRAFRHSTRTTPLQEAAVLATLGYEDVPTICRQLDFYAAQYPADTITPLTTGTVLLRSHHHPAVRKFGQLWWESILAFSKRDQLSLDYARQEAGIEIDYFDGITRDNDLVHWNGSYAQHRIKANFDAKRYAWQHRDDADAVRDPKAHFLATGSEDDSAYVADTSMLDFLCWKHGSSLGTQVAPRRHLADTLESLLKPTAVAGQRHLLVRVRHAAGAQAFSDLELDTATQALGVLTSPAGALNVVDLEASQLREGGDVLVCPQPGFDVLVVIGAAGAQLGAVITQLGRLGNLSAGRLVVVLGDPAPMETTVRAESAFLQTLQLRGSSACFAGRHDDLRGSQGNTVYTLGWVAEAVSVEPSAPQNTTAA